MWRTTEPQTFDFAFVEISIHVLRVEDDKSVSIIDCNSADFNPRPPCGGRPSPWWRWCPCLSFQSTSSVWRTTGAARFQFCRHAISIHVLRVEDDQLKSWGLKFDFLFQSTSSVWRTTQYGKPVPAGQRFQSTSSVWRTTRDPHRAGGGYRISIHVLRVEDDHGKQRRGETLKHFNPRPPCGGRHGIPAAVPHGCGDFNPRPPCGGRPGRGEAVHRIHQFQSTSSVWRTTGRRPFRVTGSSISIHVLRVEDDRGSRGYHTHEANFNPRPPCGGRRYGAGDVVASAFISIHVLRVEDDGVIKPSSERWKNFNPRPPCGGRHSGGSPKGGTAIFQSTSSVWRTTAWESTSRSPRKFQSTSSVWRTTEQREEMAKAVLFQSTSSVWRTTSSCSPAIRRALISIHVLRVEDDTPWPP